MKSKPWIAVILRAALPAGGGFMSSEKLLYFTYQSNLWALVLTAVYFVLGVMRLIRGKVKVPRALQIARYAASVSVTITFLVFWGLLSPVFRLQNLLTLNNLLLHAVVPVLFAADFLLFDRGEPIGRVSGLWAAFLPLYYLLFSLSYSAAHPGYVYKTGGRYAYFFPGLDRYGWFGTDAGRAYAGGRCFYLRSRPSSAISAALSN